MGGKKNKKKKIKYQPADWSPDEIEFYSQVLLEELEIQNWFTNGYSTLLGEEVFIVIQ